MKLLGLLVVVLAIASVHSLSLSKADTSPIRYDGFAVYRIAVQNPKQREFFEGLAENTKNFNVWHSSETEVDLMVSPKLNKFLQSLFKAAGVQADVMIPDVQKLMDDEQVSVSSRSESFGWTRYFSLEAIYTWLDGILAEYPTVTEAIWVGESYEGRDIRGIKISHNPGKPGIFIESNIHAREWITSATATWLIDQLLRSTDPSVRQLAENYDWYIIPVFNVDGFDYTHTKDRMWRKTRSPSATSACYGADANRNWNSYWMVNGGASSNPCAENYAGPNAHSEPEVNALSRYIASIKDRVNILFAFHSYSQMLLAPYGHTKEEVPPNYAHLMQVANAYVDAVRSLPYQTEYEAGTAAGLLYAASGTTSDWAYNEQDVKLSFTIEFRDTGRFGFILPPVQILPNCEETMAGLKALIKEAETLGYTQIKYTV